MGTADSLLLRRQATSRILVLTKRSNLMVKTRAAKRTTTQRRRDDTPHADAEQRILDAAHRVFLRRGSAGARTQEIADEAGVNKALLHYYFRTKERLAAAVFRRAATKLLPPVIATLASDEDLETKVARVIEIELDVLVQHPYLPGYIIAEITHQPARVKELIAALTGVAIDDLTPRLFRIIGLQIRDNVREGKMRPVAPDQFLLNLLSLCVFPFAARPMVQALLELDDDGFTRFIARRKRELPIFFLQGLRP
jgi:AcrR family transcriptional regulator